jgi:Tfp pilus assembly protein PilO
MAKNKTTTTTSSAKRMGPVEWMRIVLVVLLAVNIAGAWMIYNPPGGSAEALDQELVRLQAAVKKAKDTLEEAKHRSGGLDEGRAHADEFLNQYFVTRRAVSSTLVGELNGIAKRAGIKDRGNGFTIELIDGSDTLGMVTIAANFEGSYKTLLNFVREIDRSNSLVIIESLTATPIQNQKDNSLNVSIKLDAFVKDDPSAFPAEPKAVAENTAGVTR